MDFARSAPILDIADAGMVRELRAFSTAQRARVNKTISLMLLQWRSAWVWRADHDDIHGYDLQISDVTEPGRASAWKNEWMTWELGCQGAGILRARWATGDVGLVAAFPVERLAIHLWGPTDERQLPEPVPVAGSLAAEMAGAMWRDLLQRWVELCTSRGDISENPSGMEPRLVEWAHPDEFSGFLFVEFSIAGLHMTVALDAASIDAILARTQDGASKADEKSANQPRPIRLDVALGKRTLKLDAYLQPATVSLGELGSLRVGDVVALDHPLSHPALVFSQGREEVARAWLAQTRGYKSLELASTQE